MPSSAPQTSAHPAPGTTTVGIIGAGHIGGQLARLLVAHGYPVVISNSRGPDTLIELVAELGPLARAGTVHDAAIAGDLVVVTTPLSAVQTLPAEELAGKVVIDTDNYYPQRDGHIPELDDETTTVSERLQVFLPNAHVVKAFNHIYAAALTTDALPAGSDNRRALAVAGNEASARATVCRLIDDLGFDVVDLGPLAEGWRIQRDTPGYGPRMDAFELREAVSTAIRYRDME
ncbi:NADP oxidoreductase [Cryobacterium melibiosiphilum]|uniref:NADP oxidoreductase n=1 Tax=Cryobacterium melibiosiphilum TaxID=995039 RepID=A0A3A5MKE4_9MICO|nr:NAD(P)-binding domain-containing protein [Cryobacterium melibiosiphilum]RJT87558.1 NADP oxidoreductase [Cryobacterium melibiosiphilum]